MKLKKKSTIKMDTHPYYYVLLTNSFIIYLNVLFKTWRVDTRIVPINFYKYFFLKNIYFSSVMDYNF